MEKLILPIKDADRQNIAKLLIKTNNWEVLEKFLEQESSEIREIYYSWKIKQSEKKAIGWSSPSDLSLKENEEQFAETFERLPDEMTILVLGEVGVGKSTFINAMANYLSYSTLLLAMKQGIETVLPVKLHIANNIENSREEYEITTVSYNPTILPERDVNDGQENEDFEQTDSCTQMPKSYLLSFKSGKKTKKIRIIDTPGIENIGTKKGNDNIQNILNYMQNFKQINAICFLLKPHEITLSRLFSTFFDKFLFQLSEEAIMNILFCFTNTRTTNFKIGETIRPLEQFLNEKRQIYKNLPLIKESGFCFENDCFRFLCGYFYGIDYNLNQIGLFNKSWECSNKELMRLLDKVAQLKPVNVGEKASISLLRNTILTFAGPLIGITKALFINQYLIKQKISEVKSDYSKPQSSIIFNQVKLTAKKLEHPQLVCISPTCVMYRKESTEKSAYIINKITSSVCHNKCYLRGVTSGESLKNCYVFHIDTENCSVCGCSWRTHVHQRYILEATTDELHFLDSLVIGENNSAKLHTLLERLKDEFDSLIDYLVQFSTFLNEDESYEKDFIERFDYYLKRTNWTEDLINTDLLQEIATKYKEKAQKAKQDKISAEKVRGILAKLENKEYWDLLKKVQEYENVSRYKQTDDPATAVHLQRRSRKPYNIFK